MTQQYPQALQSFQHFS